MSADRPMQTTADFMVIALSPALIMGLIGSLVFFLLEVLYAGAYSGNLQWILFFFVFGAVLVARISLLGQISERSGIYGFVLGLAVWLGMQRFVDYPSGTAAAQFSWLINLGLVVLVYVAVLMSRRPVSHTLVVPQIALVALLFGTTSVVYDVPRYPWTYKHVGVTEYILENASVDRSVDIYHNFPEFFWLTAGISQVTGVEPLTLAQWAQPVLALLTAAAVYWVVGGLTSSRRIRYGAVLLYTLGDWIGQKGIEGAYERLLAGTNGERRVIVDSHGREVSEAQRLEASPGQNLFLSVDLKLQ